MRTPATYNDRDERRLIELAAQAADLPATEAAAMIERCGKEMLDMSADEIEARFGHVIRAAFERGYLHGCSAVIYPVGGLRYRACTSGLTQRLRFRRIAKRIEAMEERRATA